MSDQAEEEVVVPESLQTEESVEVTEEIPAADRVVIKGKPENIEKAFAALKALVPESESVAVSSELFGGLIGPKGETVRKIMTEFDVNIKIPSATSGENAVVVKGLRANIDKAKEAIAAQVVLLEADKAVCF